MDVLDSRAWCIVEGRNGKFKQLKRLRLRHWPVVTSTMHWPTVAEHHRLPQPQLVYALLPKPNLCTAGAEFIIRARDKHFVCVCDRENGRRSTAA